MLNLLDVFLILQLSVRNERVPANKKGGKDSGNDMGKIHHDLTVRPKVNSEDLSKDLGVVLANWKEKAV